MERAVPWAAMRAPFALVQPKPGGGRPPVRVEPMQRVHFLQHLFNLSDRAVEEALYDAAAMRGFVGIYLGREPVPDEATACRFRQMLERHNLGGRLFEEVHRHLDANGLKVSTGTVMDAAIVDVPSSTGNAGKARDSDMYMDRTKEGNQLYFGMKAHAGVDSRTKIIHAVPATAAKVADCEILPDPPHGEGTRVWGGLA